MKNNLARKERHFYYPSLRRFSGVWMSRRHIPASEKLDSLGVSWRLDKKERVFWKERKRESALSNYLFRHKSHYQLQLQNWLRQLLRRLRPLHPQFDAPPATPAKFDLYEKVYQTQFKKNCFWPHEEKAHLSPYIDI